MKTSSILLSALFLLLPWCMAPLIAQTQNETAVEKKIVIIKRTIDADGSEVTETIVKKGKAAENFDVDKFVRENRDDKTEVEVIVKDVNESKFPGWDQVNNLGWTSCDNDKGAFLGVEPDSDENDNEPGVVVQIVRGSAAEKAGLRHNDKILQLNSTKMNEWDDLTKVIQAAKPGDQMKVTYSRNGKETTTTAALTTRKDVKCDEETAKKGFLGVSGMDEREGKGLEVSIVDGSGAEKAGLKDGDVLVKLNETAIADFEDVSDFMAYTKPGEKVLVAYERDGKLTTTEAVLSEQNTYNWNGGNIHIQVPEINLKGLDRVQNNIACTIKEKEACLGVYSNDSDDSGAAIQSFTDESAAREVGMQAGDLILSVNGQNVKGHSELWNEIAKYKTGEKVAVAYERDGQPFNVQATLKACKDNLKKVDIKGQENTDNRSFYLWNWGDADDRRQYKETRIIIIRRAGEGDAAKLNVSPNQSQPVEDRSLSLQGFRAYPNPSQGQVTVEFTRRTGQHHRFPAGHLRAPTFPRRAECFQRTIQPAI
jgi:S1-C subfamily serine protease